MRFTSFVAAGLLAVSASAQTSATSSAAAAATSALSEIEQCLNDCDPADVTCRAHCIAVPSPDDASANATTDCAAKCDKGDGSAEQNVAWGECVQGCIEDYYFASTGTPNLATSKAGGSDHSTPVVTNVQTTFTSGGSTFTSTFPSTVASADPSESAGPAETTSGNAAAVYGPVGAGMGLFGLLAGVLAL
jgi:acyl-homoserine lactone acylase PvdQ